MTWFFHSSCSIVTEYAGCKIKQSHLQHPLFKLITLSTEYVGCNILVQ